MTDHSELKRLLDAQVSLHKVARETETIEDEDRYLSADDELNEYLTGENQYIEDIALSLIAESDALRKDAERYRWLQVPNRSAIEFDSAFDEFGIPINSVIDEAISKRKEI
ncbi:hypothetical protein K5E40_03620 [Pseudomonas baetica]|uniref:hypothetical protein n=1 Tax=Pseudomonas baetica TaxID=674054 RepID=UPI001C8C0853|nr:hypothetical protein [Pseudomonas baetica]MBX9404763.1 hypothetical protein [Pseudomonas baetica]